VVTGYKTVVWLQGRVQEAIACYEHVSLLQSESPEAHANLASAYKDAARPDTAITSYQWALQLRPDFPEAFANLVHSLQCVCEWKDRPHMFARLEAEVPPLLPPLGPPRPLPLSLPLPLPLWFKPCSAWFATPVPPETQSLSIKPTS